MKSLLFGLMVAFGLSSQIQALEIYPTATVIQTEVDAGSTHQRSNCAVSLKVPMETRGIILWNRPHVVVPLGITAYGKEQVQVTVLSGPAPSPTAHQVRSLIAGANTVSVTLTDPGAYVINYAGCNGISLGTTKVIVTKQNTYNQQITSRLYDDGDLSVRYSISQRDSSQWRGDLEYRKTDDDAVSSVGVTYAW